MAYLIEVLLPVKDPELFRTQLAETHKGLVEKFGGATSYINAPAAGLWNDGDQVQKDRIVVVEVMASAIDHLWWIVFKKRLEATFQQKGIVIRSSFVERI